MATTEKEKALCDLLSAKVLSVAPKAVFSVTITPLSDFSGISESVAIVEIDRGNYFLFRDFEYGKGRKFFEKLRVDYEEFRIKFKEKSPGLVQADVGDFVLIYRDFMPARDEDSDVGIVNSKFLDANGKTIYGCRYISFNVNDSFAKKFAFSTIGITDEDYGGYPTGFLKVLSASEMNKLLSKRLVQTYQKARENLVEQEKKAVDDLKKLMKILTKDVVVQDIKVLSLKRDEHYSEMPEDFYQKEGRNSE